MATSKAFILVLSCLYLFSYVLAAHELSDTAMAEIHEKWMGRYGRVYKDAAEKARRFEVFRDNIAFIESFNAGNNKFWLEANQFADLTNDEFRAARTNKGWKQNMAKVPTRFKYENVSTDAFPADRGLEDQGSCHSLSRIEANVLSCCWAFSAVAATEGIVKLSMGQLISLSEQELVDCDTHSMDEGRDGGEKESAFEFIIKNGGLATESSSPYKAEDGGTCKNGSQIAATIKGYEDVPANNEAALIKAVAHQPVSVAVDTGDKTFQRYSGGVMTVSCSTDLDHAIAVVIESDGTKYWILKNSWGTSWEEKEYYFRFKI